MILKDTFKTLALLGILGLLLTQCMPAKEEVLTEIKLDFKDPVYQQLYTYQDQLLTDSLIPFFTHRDPSYRYAAALALASVKDEVAIDPLIKLLSDEVAPVKTAAAYALGQIGSEKAQDQLVNAFMADTLATDFEFKRTILEAVGKSATDKYLPAISSIKTYQRLDTLLLKGQAYGIYRYALRDIVSEDGTQHMLKLLTKRGYPEEVKLIAANYLYRARNIKLDSVAGPLYSVVQRTDNPQILMALAIALGKTRHPVGLEALKYLYNKSDDYRVKVNTIRALGNYDYLEIKDIILLALEAKNIHLANAASTFLINNGNARDAMLYFNTAKNGEQLHWQTRANLFQAANRHIPSYFANTKGAINAEIKKRFEIPNDNLYEQAALLQALSEYGWNYKYLYEKGFSSEQSIIRSASVQALTNIGMNSGFEKFFGLGSKKVKKDLALYFTEAVENGDIAMIAHAAQALRIPELGFRELLDSTEFLVSAMSKLELPKEMEINYELQKTIDFFNGQTTTKNLPPRFNHPIDWDMFNGINPDAKAQLFTAKGEITIQLMPHHAPGTVTNFVQLARNNFYDNKNFHRVIPNFVVQGGCPRGDGYGGLDYTIRSELGPAFYDDEGYIGMASAGNHTECTQWFITHSPTPHLDGNYTIFGKVIKGMDIVHQLQIGDRIIDIKIRN